MQSVTGIEADKTTLKAISANISNTVRRFNIQEGLRREDDRLPGRLYKEALKSGHRISEAELDSMLTDYYRLRGWDEEGKPTSNPISDSKKMNRPKIARSRSLLLANNVDR